MEYKKSKKVYSCCGQYLVPIGGAINKDIICPRCGEKIKSTVKLPHIIIVSDN